MESDKKKIKGGIDFSQDWYRQAFNINEPEPFSENPDAQLKRDELKSRLLGKRYADLPFFRGGGARRYRLPQYDGATVIMSAFGAPDPVWEESSASFWRSRDYKPWSNIKTADDAANIKVPVWDETGIIRRVKEKFEAVKEHAESGSAKFDPSFNMYRWTNPDSGRAYKFTAFVSFIDLGPAMFGAEEFFSMLALEPKLCDVLLEKSFEISTSYSEYMLKTFGGSLDGICSFGGDYACMLSPQLYRRYAAKFDMMLAQRYGSMPYNLHSCGPSAHLYSVWGEYAVKDDIVLMQTRGIEGGLERLREALPDTYLQITIHQPQFDFEEEKPRSIRKLVESYAEQAGYHDLELTVIVSKNTDKADYNIRVFFETIDEINSRN